MTSNYASLDAAATERKARLAKLKSLKRKEHPTDSDDTAPLPSETTITIPNKDSSLTVPESTTQYLSGRNYDSETRGPRLGFENAPSGDADTLEDRAATIASAVREKEEKETKEEKPIDLFQLQPKKPNWDLKRDMARKMEALNARTDNAIARLVRERIEGQQKDSEGRNGVGQDEGDRDLGMGGAELVEGMHVREKEEEESIRREREQDQDSP